MKKLVPEYTLSAEQLNIAEALSKKTGLTEHIVRILYARGVDTAEKIARFMKPSKNNFLSPFLMRGMQETVDALTACMIILLDKDRHPIIQNHTTL